MTRHRKGCPETTSHLLSQDRRNLEGSPLRPPLPLPGQGWIGLWGLVAKGDLVQSPKCLDRDQTLAHDAGDERGLVERLLHSSDDSVPSLRSPPQKVAPPPWPCTTSQTTSCFHTLSFSWGCSCLSWPRSCPQMPAPGQASSLSLEGCPAPSSVSLACLHTAWMGLKLLLPCSPALNSPSARGSTPAPSLALVLGLPQLPGCPLSLFSPSCVLCPGSVLRHVHLPHRVASSFSVHCLFSWAIPH